jgi:hypothetical protein
MHCSILLAWVAAAVAACGGQSLDGDGPPAGRAGHVGTGALGAPGVEGSSGVQAPPVPSQGCVCDGTSWACEGFF